MTSMIKDTGLSIRGCLKFGAKPFQPTKLLAKPELSASLVQDNLVFDGTSFSLQ